MFLFQAWLWKNPAKQAVGFYLRTWHLFNNMSSLSKLSDWSPLLSHSGEMICLKGKQSINKLNELYIVLDSLMVQSSVYCTFQIPSRVLLINIHQYKSIPLNLGFVAQISHSQDASPKAFPRLDHMSPSLKTCQSIMFTLSVVYQLDTMAKLAIQALNIHVIVSRLTST